MEPFGCESHLHRHPLSGRVWLRDNLLHLSSQLRDASDSMKTSLCDALGAFATWHYFLFSYLLKKYRYNYNNKTNLYKQLSTCLLIHFKSQVMLVFSLLGVEMKYFFSACYYSFAGFYMQINSNKMEQLQRCSSYILRAFTWGTFIFNVSHKWECQLSLCTGSSFIISIFSKTNSLHVK